MAVELKSDFVWKLFFIVLGIFIAAVTSVSGWMLLRVHEHDIYLGSIRSSRCTGDKCDAMHDNINLLTSRLDTITIQGPHKETTKELSSIKERLAIVEYQLGSNRSK